MTVRKEHDAMTSCHRERAQYGTAPRKGYACQEPYPEERRHPSYFSKKEEKTINRNINGNVNADPELEPGQEDRPAWLTRHNTVKEPVFCYWFLSNYPMKCINGRFYSEDGLIEDEGSLRKLIYDELSVWLDSGVSKRTEELIKALRIASFSDPIPPDFERIHVANGTLQLDGGFTEEKVHCLNRLNVDYRPDAPAPARWFSFHLKSRKNDENRRNYLRRTQLHPDLSLLEA